MYKGFYWWKIAFICSHIPGSIVVVCLVQKLLEELKQCKPQNVIGISLGLITIVFK